MLFAVKTVQRSAQFAKPFDIVAVSVSPLTGRNIRVIRVLASSLTCTLSICWTCVLLVICNVWTAHSRFVMEIIDVCIWDLVVSPQFVTTTQVYVMGEVFVDAPLTPYALALC